MDIVGLMGGVWKVQNKPYSRASGSPHRTLYAGLSFLTWQSKAFMEWELQVPRFTSSAFQASDFAPWASHSATTQQVELHRDKDGGLTGFLLLRVKEVQGRVEAINFQRS